jgi:hypothetical protein
LLRKHGPCVAETYHGSFVLVGPMGVTPAFVTKVAA